MNKLTSYLQKRLNTEQNDPGKMAALVERANTLPFASYTLTESEKTKLKELLEQFKQPNQSIEADFEALILVTQEVKAITNQAALLHGERIQKAQKLLKNYQEGAFTAWLYDTYGNRQTPYNLLQYYEFYSSVPQHLKPIIDQMPRQVVYTLSSRSISLSDKKAFVESYQKGQTKNELLRQIRQQFPLNSKDKRKENLAAQFFKELEKAHQLLRHSSIEFTKAERKQIHSLIDEIKKLI